MTMNNEPQSSSLDNFWMPFTANRQFKARPRLLESAEGIHYIAQGGRRILDGTAGLWCCNAGHGRREISEAVARQIATLDYAPPFQMGHPVSYTHLRAHETGRNLVCRLLLEKKKTNKHNTFVF